MALGHLYEFVTYSFDWESFFSTKACEVIGITQWVEYQNGQRTNNVLGSQVRVAITYDGTDYKLTKNEVAFSNRLKEFTFKIRIIPDMLPVHIGDKVAGSAFMNQGDFWLPEIESVKPWASGQNKSFMNELGITVKGFDWIKKTEKK